MQCCAVLLQTHIVPTPEDFAIFVHKTCADGNAAFLCALLGLLQSDFEAGIV